ncbi:MAG: CHAP domain-containing protein [Solirubrobacteraceae bacterium]
MAHSRHAIKRALGGALVAGVALLALTGSAAAATIRGRILSAAVSQLGYHEPGDYCSKYGPCEEWCSLFATWAWEQAGVAVPRLGFVGDLYDWALARTYVESVSATPTPGDAVLFGTGPENVDTSLHVGIVEDVYPTGYLVTIEGDVIHGVRRVVVPIRDPQSVGEPGPIYAYAAPVARDGGPAPAALLASGTGRAASVGVDWAAVNRVQERTIRSLRAFQHMPYRTADVGIDWTGVDRAGRVEVRVASALHLTAAREAWQRFLARYHDAGRAYVVSFQALPDIPVDRVAPSISGTATEGQALTASAGVWSHQPTSYVYQWQDCGSSSCSAIAGATGQTYTVTATDVGQAIRVVETAGNAGGAGRPAASAPTAVVGDAAPALSAGGS